MSFSTLQINPRRELFELAQQYGWHVRFPDSKRNGSVMVEAIVDGTNFHEAASATNRSKRGATRVASQLLISKLKVILLL